MLCMGDDEKRYDGVAVLSKVSGLPRAEVQELWQQVKANQARLDACPGPHRFDGHGRRDYRCSECGGTVSAIAYVWYVAGLEHAKR